MAKCVTHHTGCDCYELVRVAERNAFKVEFAELQKQALPLIGENARLKADRAAFAEETQKYRDAWMQDQQTIAKLREELAAIRKDPMQLYSEELGEE